MWETLQADPYQIGTIVFYGLIALAFIAFVAIKAWRRNESSKREAEIKMEMLARGMSADDIVRVLTAGSSRKTELSETQPYAKK